MAQDYKKAQIQGTASTGTYATLYTTPAGKQALISTILVCNTDVNNPVTVRVGFDDTAGTPDSALGEWLVYDAVVAAGDTLTLSLGISMGQEKFLRVSSSNTNANFTAFVVEIGASGNSILPAFLAINGTERTNVTGSAETYTMVWDTEVYDQGNDFDGTSTFTAPVTGKYQFNCMLYIQGLATASHTYCELRLLTSNRQYNQQYQVITDGQGQSHHLNVLADMDSADTATLSIKVAGSSTVVDVIGSSTYNNFSGFLVA